SRPGALLRTRRVEDAAKRNSQQSGWGRSAQVAGVRLRFRSGGPGHRRGRIREGSCWSSLPNLLTLGPVALRFSRHAQKKKDGRHMSAKVVGPRDGKAGFLGSIGVRFMIDGAEAGGGFSLVEHPMSPRALAPPLP